VIRDLEGHDFVVVLKARQLGLSWCALAYGLWRANCNDGVTVLILNRSLGTSIELLHRVRFMWRRLAEELRIRVIGDSDDPKMPRLMFENGSRIISLPSGEDAGTGLTAQVVIADEVGKWSVSPEETMTSVLATLSGGGS
jgi:hypothetical protein